MNDDIFTYVMISCVFGLVHSGQSKVEEQYLQYSNRVAITMVRAKWRNSIYSIVIEWQFLWSEESGGTVCTV